MAAFCKESQFDWHDFSISEELKEVPNGYMKGTPICEAWGFEAVAKDEEGNEAVLYWRDGTGYIPADFDPNAEPMLSVAEEHTDVITFMQVYNIPHNVVPKTKFTWSE